MGPHLRPATDEDSDGIIALIDSCYREYPPNILLVDEEEPELRTPASSFACFWVLESNNAIVGSVAGSFKGDLVELKKMYLFPEFRGSGWAEKLQAQVIAFATEKKMQLELWTDTRFNRAHRFYEKAGWVKTGETRELHDASQTTEFRFIFSGVQSSKCSSP